MIWNALQLALREIRRNLMRSFLTILGIVIGVSAVITMVTLGNGATRAVSDQIASLGSNLLMVRPGQRLGPLGRHHLPSAHDEQGIIQRLAQSPQRMADGGLGEVEPLCCPGNVALLHQHVEHIEQVEVEAGKGEFHRYWP